MRLVLNITSSCNFHCITCIREHPKTVSNISVGLINKVLKEVKKLKINEIEITGGEPCFHPEFEKILATIVKNGFSFSVVSNGSLDEKYDFLVEKYKDYMRGITFSVDSASEEIHDEIRRKGSFQEVLKSIHYFVSQEIKTYISMCLNQINMHQIEPVIQLAKSLEVEKAFFMAAVKTSSNKHIVLTDEEKKMCKLKIYEMERQHHFPVKTAASLGTRGGIEFCGGLNLSSIEINPRGEVSFCCDTIGDGAIVGSLDNSTFFELYSKCLDLSHQLKKKRLEMLSKNKTMEGFNTCEFCNTFLKNYIKKPSP